VICPLCGSGRVSAGERYQSPFVDRRYTLFDCESCTSAFFDVDEHEIDLERIYEVHAEEKASDYSAEVPVSYYWRRQVEILQTLHDDPVESVLDVGCRTGDFLMHWPDRVERVGVELARRSAEIAEGRGLKVVQGFVEDAEFDHGFDVISCFAVVEHLKQPAPFLQHLVTRLNPKGVLVVLVPTRECLKHGLLSGSRAQWHMYSPPQHLNFVSRHRLDEILEACGLELAERRFTSGGMFNPLRRVPRLNAIFDRLMSRIDHSSPLNRLPLFDHMYSFYRKA
jgi:SAM-dependent methyltransferase